MAVSSVITINGTVYFLRNKYNVSSVNKANHIVNEEKWCLLL